MMLRVMTVPAHSSSPQSLNTPPAPPVRLDALSGPVTVALAESIQVPEGRVTWVRLHLIPGESYIEDSAGAQHSLICPSCEPTDNNAERGFKLNRTFAVAADAHIAMTVDIDLRKSLTQQGVSQNYVLRPTARMLPDEELGTIAGQVDGSATRASVGLARG